MNLIEELQALVIELDDQARDSASTGMPDAAAAYREARDKLRLLVKRAKRENSDG